MTLSKKELGIIAMNAGTTCLELQLKIAEKIANQPAIMTKRGNLKKVPTAKILIECLEEDICAA